VSLPAGFWVLAGIGILGELGPLVGRRRQRPGVYLSACTSLAILLVWGFWPALAAQTAASVVAAVRSQLSAGGRALLVARTAAATVLAATVVAVSGLGTVRRSEGIESSLLLDLLLVILAWLVAYYVPAVVIERWRGKETWQTIFKGLGAEVFASASLLSLGPVVVAELRGLTFVLLAVPLLALNQLSGVISRQAETLRRDSGTGLLNLRGLADIAGELGRRRRREQGRFAVLLVRLDNVRALDDAFGRSVVNAVLVSVADRIALAFGESATVGRPDSDDLVVLIRRDDESDTPERIISGGWMIQRSVAAPAIVDGLPFDATATVGIARSPEDAEDLISLLRQADAAVRGGQHQHISVFQYVPTPQQEIDARLGLLTDLNAALSGQAAGGHIEFAYQPQVRLDTGDVVAVEALLRWTHPQRGAVSPEDLLTVAEPTPLMHELTKLGITTVAHQLREWRQLGIHLQAALNVSVHDLGQDWLVDEILDQLRACAIPGRQLVIEVTESEVISDPEQVRRSVERLADAEIQVAVDDFGSGFASIQHLRQLRLNQLKIDKGLVRTIAENRADRVVVRSVIELAQALDLAVIAEGVENRAVHDTLRDLGCPMGQGWLYGRPSSGPEITRRLSTHPSSTDQR
jgi:diguanylate cyclase (GGDEF)-like protein